MISFPAFEPDRAPYSPNSNDQTINVLPAVDGYKPMPTLREVSEALDDECIGAFSVSNNGGFAFIAGTRTKLFRLDTSITPDATTVDESGNLYDKDGQFVGNQDAINHTYYDAAIGMATNITGAGPAAEGVKYAGKAAIKSAAQSPTMRWYSGGILKNGKGLGISAFKGANGPQIDLSLKAKNFSIRGGDPISGKGGYVNPTTQRSYHYDPNNSHNEPPHVDVNRIRSYKGPLEKRKYFTGR